MKNYIDLHIHSKYSDDGEFTPETLVEKCRERNNCFFSYFCMEF
jgi:predicted metal-dependent phosphoesterase TrpH